MIAGSAVVGAPAARLAAAVLLSCGGLLLSWAWPVAGQALGARRHAITALPGSEGARGGGRRRGVPDVETAARRLPAVAATAAVALSLGLFDVRTGAVVAVPMAAIAWWATTVLSRRARPAEPEENLPLSLDLAAAALRSGRPVAEALELAAPVAPRFAAALARVAGLLRLGAAPDEAWAGVAEGPLAPVARIAIRSETSGVRLAGSLESLAAQLRADLHAAGLARAHRAGVLVLAPLGACFLPAFVCLGIVPVVVGIARSVGSTLP